MTMGEYGRGSSRDVATTSPTNDPDEPGAKTSARSASGGGYGPQALAALEAAGYPAQDHGSRVNPNQSGEHTSGDPGWWDRGVHAAG
jgi:hypothetical protein